MEPYQTKITVEELKAEAALFIAAGKRYWDKAQSFGLGGAIIWTQDLDGFGVVYTRGEYRHQIMYNIDALRKPVHFGSVQDD